MYVDKQEDITEGKHQKFRKKYLQIGTNQSEHWPSVLWCNGAQIGLSQSVQPRPKDRQMNGHWIL